MTIPLYSSEVMLSCLKNSQLALPNFLVCVISRCRYFGKLYHIHLPCACSPNLTNLDHIRGQCIRRVSKYNSSSFFTYKILL